MCSISTLTSHSHDYFDVRILTSASHKAASYTNCKLCYITFQHRNETVQELMVTQLNISILCHIKINICCY